MLDGRINRIKFLGMPVDAAEQEAVYDAIEQMLLDGQRHRIVLLTVQKLLRAKFDLELNRCIRQAALILPVSKGIIRGARFQRKPQLQRYNPFEFVIRLLALAERLEKSIYLLGAKKEELEQAEKNLKISFPNLKVVGRYSGYFDKSMEQNIILAIRKSSPAFLLVGKGIAHRDKWIARNQDGIHPGIYLSADNCFEIFAGTERNIPKKLFRLGLEYLNDIFQKPWKVFAVFPYLYFKMLVLVYKIRGI
jgi:N-acetylglucosaminyldiphosphoundecaprenol N-acetyl-beta-D-mannosaminyltransferase